jgi:DNA-directed RNA polymerase specialized sigma24 family protein
VSETTSVTIWLERLKAGQRDEATRHLWEAYFAQLVRRAQALLGSWTGASAGPEDVAISAFHSFVRAVEQGRFPRLEDRQDLWQVLLVLTARKAGKLRRSERAQRRGGGRVVSFSELEGAAEGAVPGFACGEPDPAETAALAETLTRVLDGLGSDELRQVALLRLEGHSNAEIAQRLGRHEGTVERKLRAIRDIWEAIEDERAEPRP